MEEIFYTFGVFEFFDITVIEFIKHEIFFTLVN